jgi:hypothetical protein
MKRYALLGLLLVLSGCGSGGGGGAAHVASKAVFVRLANPARLDGHTVGSFSFVALAASFEHPGNDISISPGQPSPLFMSPGGTGDTIVTNVPVNIRVRLYESSDATGPILQEFNKVVTVSDINTMNPGGHFGYEIDLQSSGNLIP